MAVNELSGMTLKKEDSGEKKIIFADTPYSYYLYRLAKDETIRLDQLNSFSVFVMTASSKKAIIIKETGITLNQGDMVQVENSTISFEAMAPGVELLVAGISVSYTKDEAVNIVREKNVYKVIKPWGYELWINGEHPGYVLKKIRINAGTRTSLQYHRYKHETNVIFAGEANIHYKKQTRISNDEATLDDIEAIKVLPITSVTVCPDTLHRVEALTDIILCETSTPHLDDVIRIQDDMVRDNGRITTEHGALS